MVFPASKGLMNFVWLEYLTHLMKVCEWRVPITVWICNVNYAEAGLICCVSCKLYQYILSIFCSNYKMDILLTMLFFLCQKVFSILMMHFNIVFINPAQMQLFGLESTFEGFIYIIINEWLCCIIQLVLLSYIFFSISMHSFSFILSFLLVFPPYKLILIWHYLNYKSSVQ